MIDFYDIIKTDDIKETLSKYMGDESLTYLLSNDNIHLDLTDFTLLSDENEVPFIMYMTNNRVVDMDVSNVANSKDYCSWFTNNFIYDCICKAQENNYEIILGHTHPTFKNRVYGSIPSCIHYFDEDYTMESVTNDFYGFNFFINNELYRKYGGDYCELITLHKTFRQISNTTVIYNHTLNSFGFMKLYDGGIVKYRKIIL